MHSNIGIMHLAALIGAVMIGLPTIAMAEDGSTKVGYEKGFFIQGGDDFLMRIGARLQSRLSFEKPDEGDNAIFFNIPRARLTFSGYAFSPDLSYKFQSDFGKGQASLKDFYMDYAVSKGAFHIRIGQQKRPFSRQFICSSSKLMLVDRAPTTQAFGLGRDIGLVMHNNMTQSPTVEWAFGILNGTRVESKVDGTQFTNAIDHFEPALVARLGYNHGKLKGYSEADLEGGDLRFGIAAGAYATLDMDDNKDAFLKATVDTMLKVNGFALSGAFYMQMDQDGDSFTDQKMGWMGAFAQVSYAIDSQYVPAARFTWLNDDDADIRTMEICGGFSALFFQHKVKWQTDVAVVMTKVGDASSSDIVGRSQLQFNF